MFVSTWQFSSLPSSFLRPSSHRNLCTGEQSDPLTWGAGSKMLLSDHTSQIRAKIETLSEFGDRAFHPGAISCSNVSEFCLGSERFRL